MSTDALLVDAALLIMAGLCGYLEWFRRSEARRYERFIDRLVDGDVRRWLASLPKHPVEPDVFAPRGFIYLVNTDLMRPPKVKS